jgi:lysophospholipase L1-like esterase
VILAAAACSRDGGEKTLQGPIVCFGDSLTYGTGAPPGRDYPSQLSKMIARPVINAGVPGDTTAGALRRLERDVLDRSPAFVLITLGGNDLKNGVGVEAAYRNLKRIVSTIQDRGARVVIGGLNFPLADRGYGRMYRRLAEETGATLIPHVLEDIMGRPGLMSDPIHPNGDGYARMAAAFESALSSLR